MWPRWKLVLFSLLGLVLIVYGFWQIFTGPDIESRLEGVVCAFLCGGAFGFAVFVKAGGNGKLSTLPGGRREIGMARWQYALLIVIGLALVPAGWMIAFVIGNSTPFFPTAVQHAVAVATGLLSALCGLFLVYYAIVKRKTVGKLAILPEGLELCSWGFAPRVIPWRDIEGFGAVQIAEQDYTTVRLSSYESILKNLTKLEADAVRKFYKRYRMFAAVTVVVAVANLSDPSDLIRTIPGSAQSESVDQILLFSRKRFGGEFLLPAVMRDRSAEDFSAFLEGLRQSGSGVLEAG